MQTFIEPLYAELEAGLAAIKARDLTPLNMAIESVAETHAILDRLRQVIIKYRFKNEAEEILFFRKVKPQFLSRLLLYHKVIQIELRRPVCSTSLIQEYLQTAIQQAESYYDQHRDFYGYYRMNCAYLDAWYFTRKHFDVRLVAGHDFNYGDAQFSTTHDGIVAMFIANEFLLEYLHRALAEATQPDKPARSSHPGMQWTDSKAALVELIYGLQALGVIDEGKADIKMMATQFEAFFHIELGDYYRTWLDLRMRKTGKTKFMDAMRDRLLRRMEESDDRY